LLNVIPREHGIALCLCKEDIDASGSNGFMLLELIAAHQRAKLSQAICAGQVKALVAGKRINRPKVPRRIRNGIPSALTMVTGSDLRRASSTSARRASSTSAAR